MEVPVEPEMLFNYEADWRQYAFPEDQVHLASECELQEKYSTVELTPDTILDAAGMPVLSDGHTATLNTQNDMTLIYGETGSKKSRVLISVLIALLSLAGESMIIPDIKGELSSGILAPKIRGILEKRKYNIRVLNFRTLNGDGFNILGNAYEQYKAGNREEAMVQLHHIINFLAGFYKGSSSDPIWEKTAKEYLMAVAVLIFEMCDDPEKINLLSLASYTSKQSCGNLERMEPLLDQNDNILVMLRSILSEPEKTKMSTLATVSSFFSELIINKKLLKMLSTATFELDELYKEKTALFLVLPDETDAYGPVAGLILSQISTCLVSKAYEYGGPLPRRVNYICDEFCNYYVPGMARNISAHRSRNIRWYLVCQGKKQLERAYPREFGTILNNCTSIYFMGSSDSDLLEELSERAGCTNASEDGRPQRLISVENLRHIRKGWEYSEVYYASGPLTCVALLPDIDQYAFLKEFTTCDPLPVHHYKSLKIYTSEEMLNDVYAMRQAFQKKTSGRLILSESERALASRYERLFQDNN